jgi:hypothetical protein
MRTVPYRYKTSRSAATLGTIIVLRLAALKRTPIKPSSRRIRPNSPKQCVVFAWRDNNFYDRLVGLCTRGPQAVRSFHRHTAGAALSPHNTKGRSLLCILQRFVHTAIRDFKLTPASLPLLCRGCKFGLLLPPNKRCELYSSSPDSFHSLPHLLRSQGRVLTK